MTATAAKVPEQPGPPRLLLGIGLLFWGGMIGHPLAGLAVAVATEAAWWTRVRWDFGERAFYRAWQLSVLLVFFAGVIAWMNSSVLSALPSTVIWLPVLFLPLQFVQSYGMHRTMPLATFSMFVRGRRDHARKHGLPFRDVRFAFGHVYFAIILIASSVGTFATTALFFPCFVALVVWAFHRQFSLGRRLAPAFALLVLVLATAGGYSGEKLFELLMRRMIGAEVGGSSYARQTQTSIGGLGEIKQSSNIVWRIIPDEGPLPKRIRVAAYNSYANTKWWAEVPPFPDGIKPFQDFDELDSIGVEEPFRVTGREEGGEFISGDAASSPDLPRFILRGALSRNDLLPIASNSASVVIPAQNLEINSLGSLRIDPRHPVANATILWKDPLSTSKAPWTVERANRPRCPDLAIPANEQEAITRVADELGLRDLGLQEKIARIQGHFLGNFGYTRYLENPSPDSDFERDQFISRFLEETRRGHCEYFATATTMLLREAGVPARYATGFAVVERDVRSGVAILRGTHAHAWSEAWDEERKVWIDVDLTPPDWTGMETPRTPRWQGVLDRWHMLRDDLLVWRSQPGNLGIAITIIALPLVFGAALVARRLWKSKRRVDPAVERRVARATHPVTPLNSIEKAAARHLGPRPPGLPFGIWLAGLSNHLPDPSILEKAIALHRSLRFDPEAERQPDLESELGRIARELNSAIPG